MVSLQLKFKVGPREVIVYVILLHQRLTNRHKTFVSLQTLTRILQIEYRNWNANEMQDLNYFKKKYDTYRTVHEEYNGAHIKLIKDIVYNGVVSPVRYFISNIPVVHWLKHNSIINRYSFPIYKNLWASRQNNIVCNI